MKYHEAQMKRAREEHHFLNSAATSVTMDLLDQHRLKEGFLRLLSQADPGVLPGFLLWVDLKIAEYKVQSSMYRFGTQGSVESHMVQSKQEERDNTVDRRSASATSQSKSHRGLSNGHEKESRLNQSSQPSPRDCGTDRSYVIPQQQQRQQQQQQQCLPSAISIPSYSHHSSPRSDLSMADPHMSGGVASHSLPYDLSVSRIKKEPRTPVKSSEMPKPVTNFNPGYAYSYEYDSPQNLVASPRPQDIPENLSMQSSASTSHNLAHTYPILSKNLNKNVPYDSREMLDKPTTSVSLKVPTVGEPATDYQKISKPVHEHVKISKLPGEQPQVVKPRSLTPEQTYVPDLPLEHPQVSQLAAPASAIPSSGLAIKKEFGARTPEKNPEGSVEGDPAFLQTLNPSSPNTPGSAGKSPKCHVCMVCDKSFPYSSSYRRHMKLHQGVYSHVCAVCHRKFTRKEHFTRHKCNRRPNKPWRGVEGEVKPSVTGKVPKVAYPPTVAKELYNLENKENNNGSLVGESAMTQSPGGQFVDNYEGYDTPGSTASPTPSQPGGESRRKSSKPRRCVQTEEEAAVSNSFLDEDEDVNSMNSDQDSEAGDLVIDMSMEKDPEDAQTADRSSSQGSPPGLTQAIQEMVKRVVSKNKDVSQDSNSDSQVAAAPSKNGIPSPMTHPREASSPGSVLPHAEDMSGFQRNHNMSPPTSEAIDSKSNMGSIMQQAKLPASTEEHESMIHSYTSHSQMPGSPRPPSHSTVAPSGEHGNKSDILSLNTGNYVVATVAEAGDICSEDQPSPGKFIKVTKQSNYLKLQKEMRMIGGKPCFVCPHCSKVFHRGSNFSRHMRIHRGVYSYVCHNCNRGFFRKEHIQKHKCHRKAMSYVWERKTKVDMDMQQVPSEEGCNDSEGPVDEEMEAGYGGEYGIDMNDYSMEESGESSTDETTENSNHGSATITLTNQSSHSNGGITMPIPIAVPVE